MKKIAYLFALLFFTLQAHSMCPEQKGNELALKIKASSTGWKGLQSEMRMLIHSPNGKSSEMTLSSKSIEVEGDGEKVLIEFKSPLAISGTKLLSYSHINRDDEQWIHMAKTKKTKRIKGKKRSGAFLGSQFTFEDLTSFKYEKYRYSFLREESCENDTCSVIVSYPEYVGSGYYKLITWIDTKARIQKIDYYNHDRELLKTLTVKSYENLTEGLWQPTDSEMLNHKNGKSTQIIITDIAITEDISEGIFKKI